MNDLAWFGLGLAIGFLGGSLWIWRVVNRAIDEVSAELDD